MRLINTQTLELEVFNDQELPEYVILSHTWETEEVTYQDWQAPDHSAHLKGFQKIAEFCRVSINDYNVKYGWCDTNCIDKSSSSELTEAINSMYRYYQQAKCCMVYLADVGALTSDNGMNQEEVLDEIRDSRWLKRGWTLQELIAPQQIWFYGADWTCLEAETEIMEALGKPTLFTKLAEWTGIDYRVLTKQSPPSHYSVATRMSWASQRSTTRLEDEAYCLLGIFGVNMPLIYGEGRRAFIRLQEEIIRNSTDHSIFAWQSNTDGGYHSSILSWSPANFAKGPEGEIVECYHEIGTWVQPYESNNLGIRISLPCVPCTSHPNHWHAILNCRIRYNQKGPLALNLGRPIRSDVHGRALSTNNNDIEFFGLRRLGISSSQFNLQCASTHLDRLAVVQEEELLTHQPKTMFILRQTLDAQWLPWTTSPKKIESGTKRRIRVKIVWDASLEAGLAKVEKWPREEWLDDDHIWVQRSRTACIGLVTDSSGGDNIALVLTPDNAENDIELGILSEGYLQNLLEQHGNPDNPRKQAKMKSKLWAPNTVLTYSWSSLPATLACSLEIQTKFNTQFWTLTIRIKRKGANEADFTAAPIYSSTQVAPHGQVISSLFPKPMSLRSLLGFPSERD